jgi:hypothetical protein
MKIRRERRKAFHHKCTKINTKGHKEDRKTSEKTRRESSEEQSTKGTKPV